MARPFDVPRAAADGLDERSGAAEIAFLVGVENGDERNFGQIQAFAQQVDADQHVEFATPQIAQDADAIESFDFGMEIAAAHADFREIFGRSSAMRLVRVVTRTRSLRSARTRISSSRSSTWPFTGRTSICGIDEPGGTNDLLDHYAAGFGELVRPGRGGNVDDLVEAMLEFFEGERAIVERAGHAESVVHQSLLARAIAVEHAANLADGLMRLINEHQKILRNIVEQGGRSFAG